MKLASDTTSTYSTELLIYLGFKIFNFLFFRKRFTVHKSQSKNWDRKDNTCLVIIYDRVFLHYAKKHFKNRKRAIRETSKRYIFR